MSTEKNIAAQKKFGAAINSGNLDELEELVSSNVKDHDPAEGQTAGAQGYINFFTMMRIAFPDLKIEPVHIVADDNNVAFAYDISGTHEVEFMDIRPTGKKIKVRGIQISRFEDGLMVERWGSSDELGILKQLGVSPVKK